jgi:hypothetical protein
MSCVDYGRGVKTDVRGWDLARESVSKLAKRTFSQERHNFIISGEFCSRKKSVP